MNSEAVAKVSAPAKINLGLEVLRRRADGFHDLNTVFAEVDLHDEVELRSNDSGDVTLRIDGNDDLADEPPEQNLCVRAVHAAATLIGRERVPTGIEIRLSKSIPTGAGLGGGSSDAAAALSGALELWGVDRSSIEPNRLRRAAADLGSDVPFFLTGGVASAGSRGEDLTDLDIELPWTVLLIHPGLHIATGVAYRAINRTDERSPSNLEQSLRASIGDPGVLRRAMVNDFEEPVFAIHPILQTIKNRLYDAGAFFALMSGSGSTLFGLFDTSTDAGHAARQFNDVPVTICSFSTTTSRVRL